MAIKLEIKKRHLYITLILILFLAGIIIVIAVNPLTKPNPGHSSGEVMVNIDGIDKTLQEAIDAGELGGGGAVGTGVAVGTYVGDGRASRKISITDRPNDIPKMVWVARKSGYQIPFFRINNGVLYYDYQCSGWCSVIIPGDNLKAETGGFTVLHTEGVKSTNMNGQSYEYIVYY